MRELVISGIGWFFLSSRYGVFEIIYLKRNASVGLLRVIGAVFRKRSPGKNATAPGLSWVVVVVFTICNCITQTVFAFETSMKRAPDYSRIPRFQQANVPQQTCERMCFVSSRHFLAWTIRYLLKNLMVFTIYNRKLNLYYSHQMNENIRWKLTSLTFQGLLYLRLGLK